MAVLDDIRSQAEGVHQSLDDSTTLVKQAQDEAKELEESAAGHGWAAVAEAMSSAQGSLESAASAIDDAREALTDAVRELSEITDEMSSDEVARRLGEVGQQLETTQSGVNQSVAALAEARSSAEQADATTVYQLVDEADEKLRTALGTLESSISDTGTEGTEATSWGN